MSYEINVAKGRKHYFATHERSIKSEEELRVLLADLTARFPESDGYSITASARTNYILPIEGGRLKRFLKTGKLPKR